MVNYKPVERMSFPGFTFLKEYAQTFFAWIRISSRSQ
jgi:hypothetical protein